MGRHLKLLLCVPAAIAVALAAAACGSQNVSVPTANTPMHAGAVLFNQRCAGCHTLDSAAARGSAANVRTAQYNNGPNLNVRCERPIARVLYAIENGGFSGAIMPQNIVTGQEAMEVARFVSTYAGGQIPKSPGVVACGKLSVGQVPTATQVAAANRGTPAAGATGGATQESAAAGNKKVRGNAGAPTGQAQPNSGASHP